MSYRDLSSARDALDRASKAAPQLATPEYWVARAQAIATIELAQALAAIETALLRIAGRL